MKRVILAVALAGLGGTLQAQPGYVTQSDGTPVTSGFGLCVHSGFWTPAMASAPCDNVPRASLPVAPVAAAPQPVPEPAPLAQPAPEPAPLAQPAPAQEPPAAAPIVAAPPAPPPIEKVTLSADVLFEFDKAVLREEGKRQLDSLTERLRDAQVDEIVAVGHADRIGNDRYNQRLSEQRAQAVREYLQGVAPTQNIQVAGKGEAEPVTGDACKGQKDRALIRCLQPDRRVEIEVFGTRVAGGGAPAAGGTGAGSGERAAGSR